MNGHRFLPVVSVVAMFAVLACAAGLDGLVEFLREGVSMATVNPFLVLGYYTLGNLLLGALLLTLFLWNIVRLPRNGWAAAAYLLVGLYISSFPLLYFSPVGRFLPPVGFLPDTFLFAMGGIITFTGLAILIDPLKGFDRAWLE